jgi:hypothetical protein
MLAYLASGPITTPKNLWWLQVTAQTRSAQRKGRCDNDGWQSAGGSFSCQSFLRPQDSDGCTKTRSRAVPSAHVSERHARRAPQTFPGGRAASLMQCQDAGEKIQLKGKIRRTLVFDAFPRQPQLGFVQERSSFANIFIA